MTTDSRVSPRRSPAGSARVLVVSALVALLAGGVVVLVGAVVSGRTAALGAAVGAAIAVGVLAFGAFTVDAVAGLMPSAALLVALLTYGLQVVLMALALVALNGSGLLDESLDRRWLAGGLIAATMTWLAAQVTATTRARIPVYDLPAETRTGGE